MTIVMTSQVLDLLTVIISQDRSWVWTAIKQNVVVWCKTIYIQQKELYGDLCLTKDKGNYGGGIERAWGRHSTWL